MFFNPAFVNKYTPNPTASLTLSLNAKTGETKQLPNTTPKNVIIDGKRIDLTAAQQSQYQNQLGKINNTVGKALAANETFKKLPNSQQVNILSSLQTDANAVVKTQLFGGTNDLSKSQLRIMQGKIDEAINAKLQTAEKKLGRQNVNSSDQALSTDYRVSNPLTTEQYKTSNTKSGKWVKHIKSNASKYGLDADAVLAVAAVEGLGGGVGDGGTSFGPFQLHIGGALPQGRDKKWAESPEGLDYALQRIAEVAKGKKGRAAIEAIVHEFERPADPNGEVARALQAYGRVDPYTRYASFSASGGSSSGRKSGGGRRTARGGKRGGRGKKASGGVSKASLKQYMLSDITKQRGTQYKKLSDIVKRATISSKSSGSATGKKVALKKYTPKKGTVKRGNI